jgi:hypothetical protein
MIVNGDIRGNRDDALSRQIVKSRNQQRSRSSLPQPKLGYRVNGAYMIESLGRLRQESLSFPRIDRHDLHA